MASPTIRGITAPVAGGAVTSPAGTQVGDLVVVFTFERLGAGSATTLTVDTGNNYVQIDNQFHNDSSTDGAFGVAYKVATQAGAQSYQGFTSSTGTPNWATGCIVFSAGTYNIADIKVAFVSQTTNAVPNPPSVTLGATHDWQVCTIAAWHLGSAATVTPTAPTNYINLNHIAGSDDIELAIATRALSAAASEDPGTFGDDVAPSGTATFTVGIPNPLVTRGRISFSELEAPFVATRGRVSYAELETPLVGTRGRISFSEFETPITPTRGRISWAEQETPAPPGDPTRGQISFAELETPLVGTRGRISWAEVELPLTPTRGRLSFVEFEVPLVNTRGRMAWTEFEVPAAPTRGRLSFSEFQVPDLGGGGYTPWCGMSGRSGGSGGGDIDLV